MYDGHHSVYLPTFDVKNVNIFICVLSNQPIIIRQISIIHFLVFLILHLQ